MSIGAPNLRSTTSVSNLPNLSAKMERFHSGVSSPETASILQVLNRCTHSSSRAWESPFKAAVASECAQRLFGSIVRVAMIGMHPNLHPSARPDWSQRQLIVRVLDANLTGPDMDALLLSSNPLMKESTRLYVCSLLNEVPSFRLSLASVRHSMGLMASAPLELPPPPLLAAAQILVRIGVGVAAALSESAGSSNARAVAIAQVAHQFEFSEQTVKELAKTPQAQETGMVVLSYSTSWVGKASSTSDDTSGPNASSPTNALGVFTEAMNRSFRTNFYALWLHGNVDDVRTSRLAESEFTAMKNLSTSNAVFAAMGDAELLRVQRYALRCPIGTTANVLQIAHLLRLPEDDIRCLQVKTQEDTLSAICKLTPESGARFLHFCKVTSLKNNFLTFDLGDQTKRRQLNALRLRFEVDAETQDGVLAALPDHATNLFFCMECSSVPNARVELRSKVISHNELGLAQTMQRIGGIGECSDVRCARRSSAALRTAVQKQEEAESARVESIPVTRERIVRSLGDGGLGHVAKMRRDAKSVSEQTNVAMACGDREMVMISIFGRVVRVQSKFYALCTFCGCILQVLPHRRFEGEICCTRCDASMLGHEASESQALRVALAATPESKHKPPALATNIVEDGKLQCRFCGKSPPQSGGALKFRVLRAPLDNGGRNASLPPPLRTIALCGSHYRNWVDQALFTMEMPQIIAHLLEKCVPVFGADTGKRATLQITHTQPAKRSRTQKAIEKKINANKRGINSGTSRK